MKVIILSLFASLAIAGVFGTSTYGEKEDAIAEIEKKYQEVFRFAHTVYVHINQEMNRTETQIKNGTLNHTNQTMETTLNEFSDEVKRVARTAVAKGKPVSVFECLASVSFDGRSQIVHTRNDFAFRINRIVPERQRRLYVWQTAAAIVLNAVKELKTQTVKEIENSKFGIQSLKNDGLKKIDSGHKQLTAIEKAIHEPTLTKEYNDMKAEVNKRFTEIKEALYKRLQKCIL